MTGGPGRLDVSDNGCNRPALRHSGFIETRFEVYSLPLTMLHAVRSHLLAVASFLTLVVGVLVFAPGSLQSSPGGTPPGVPQLTGQDTSRAKQLVPGIEGDPRRMFGQIDSVRRDTTRRDTTRRDTTRRDTTGLRAPPRKGAFSDTTYVIYRDSSARMRNFTPVRHDNHQVEIFPRRTYPLYATPRPGGFRREVTLDSSGARVDFRETIGGVDVKIPISMPPIILRNNKSFCIILSCV